jgi:hypothetical protein
MKATYNDVVAQTHQHVHCDGDAEATGGGGALTGSLQSTTLNESFPLLPGPTGWAVKGTSTAGAEDMTGYAICAGVDANVATSNDDVSSDSSASQNAICASSEDSVTGGGIEASNTGVRIEASYPPELITDRWYGLAKNTAAEERVVYTYAVCTDAYVIKYRNSDVVRVKSGENGKASASCKPKEAVLGGGFVAYTQGLPASGGWANASRPRDSKKDRKKVPDDGWFANYHNDSVVTHRLLVRAVCKAGAAPD